MAEAQDRCLAVGMRDHFTKPINRRRLQDLLRRYMPSGALAKQDEAPSVPTPPASSSLTAKLPEKLPGFDVDAALERLDSDKGLYLTLLRDFLESTDAFAPNLSATLDGEDPDRELARRMVHALRGYAGNLAARSVHETAARLERSLRENRSDSWPEQRFAMSFALYEARSGLTVLFMEDSRKTARRNDKKVNYSAIRPLLPPLSELIARNSVESLERVKEIKVHCGGEAPNDLVALASALDRFDCKEAAVALTRLQAAIG